jgi:hypothetical protein
MADVNVSMNKLNSAIEQKLGSLSKSVSVKELGEIHAFVKEAKGLVDTLTSMYEEPAEDEECEYECDFGEGSSESDDIFMDSFVRACQLIISLYALLDDAKIKETKSKWVFEEARDFMDLARELYGPRVPTLPTMRIVSKEKQLKQAS